MERRKSLVLFALLTLAAGGCAQKVDLEAARTAIRAADVDWAKATTSGDMNTFMNYVSNSCSMLPPNQPIVTGTDAIRQWGSGMMGTPGFSITWEPQTVDVAASGDLGYSVGTYDFSVLGPDGSPMKDHGKYVTIWRKESDGKWRVVIDTFNSDVPMITAAAPSDTTTTPTN